MRHDRSIDTPDGPSGASISLALPIRDPELFKHGASRPVLNFLSDNPDINVSIRQLATVTPMSERATRAAVDVLENNGLLESHHEGNARRVQINRMRLNQPDDPISSIPQSAFRTPVRIACRYIEENLEDIHGIVLFGSVARGTADRKSDIDLWVLVGGDHMQQRHEAQELVRHLEGLQMPRTIALAKAWNVDFEEDWPAIKDKLERDASSLASAERHSFEIIVETPQSIINQADRVDAESIFGEGITLASSETLERTKLEALGDE